MRQPKKLIEVAMPIKEISAESVRDKSIRHGHISTLHLWWARRPLPVCRAVVFASLVPDPLDEHCPQAFRDAVEISLGNNDQNAGDPYKPYHDIPYTSVQDPMEDNHRNRLLMFIGKFSDKFTTNERLGKTTAAKDQLAKESLIKWDNKNDEVIIGKARKLIYVGYQCTSKGSQRSAIELLTDFEELYGTIKKAESALYTLVDRHLPTEESTQKQAALENAIEAFLDEMPRVFDPFAGGGAIPLEAARLGCRSYGNDINPVAHIIQKGGLEFPQKFGKPITYSKEGFIAQYGEQTWNELPQSSKILANGLPIAIRIENRLSFDVEFYAKKLLTAAENEIGHFYPADEKGDKPIAYYWARVGTCSNPSCQAEVPLLKQFYLANTSSKKVYLKPIIEGTNIQFEIKEGKYSEKETPGWNNKTNLTCPVCGSITDSNALKSQFKRGTTNDRLLAVITDGAKSKEYRLPNTLETNILNNIPAIDRSAIRSKMQVGNNRNFNTPGWGISDYSEMFSPRQLLALQTLVQQLQSLKSELNIDTDYGKAVVTYLGILLDRIAIANTSFGRWHNGRETLEHPFSKQAIPMMFDYPESNLFCDSTGSALNQLEWITRYIESESTIPFSVELKNASSGDKSQFADKYLTAVVTDPPYYDAIAYADLSDFFYVWLKRTLADVYPLNFATPQTPKTEECTALKHHHNDDKLQAKQHFEDKLTQIFDAIEHQTSDKVSIMFAHQSTEAWTTLCNAILRARMNITGSWAMDTEMANRSLGLAGAALTSSVTVACLPVKKEGYGEYREVKKAIETTVSAEVEKLYKLGFRGADLLTACFGQAVSEFGRYKQVEKADGSEVSVAELLEMAREAAFNALLRGFDGDEYTKFYIAWLQLYGFSESDFDDAAKFTRAGLSINVGDLFSKNIFIKNGNKQVLGSFSQRIENNRHLGEKSDSILIDQVHKAMALYAQDRISLLRFISEIAPNSESIFWRVVAALKEVIPADTDDAKYINELIINKENLIRDSKHIHKPLVQGVLNFK